MSLEYSQASIASGNEPNKIIRVRVAGGVKEMLTEDDVVDSMCGYLKAAGYRILKRCNTAEKGIDIVALLPDRSSQLLIKAKGETSAREGSKRHGKPFDGAQVRVHVAESFYWAACRYGECRRVGDLIGIVFPIPSCIAGTWTPSRQLSTPYELLCTSRTKIVPCRLLSTLPCCTCRRPSKLKKQVNWLRTTRPGWRGRRCHVRELAVAG
jgi:hypothetical protein